MAESQETSDYPGSLDTWVTLTNKEDLAEQSDINKLKAAIEAVQTELGVDVAGSKTTLDARLDQCIAENGAMRSGTSAPVSPTPQDGDFFYRTDQNVMYIYNGSTWDAQGQSLSNVLFCFGSGNDISTGNYGFANSIIDGNFPSAVIPVWFVDNTTYRIMIRSKFRKIAGVITTRVYVRGQNPTSGGFTGGVCKVDIGGQIAEIDVDASGTWYTGDVDVSGLSDTTIYDLVVSYKADSGPDTSSGFGSIIGFGL